MTASLNVIEPDSKLAVPVGPDDHATGASLRDAKHVLVEYGDYECPSCAATQPAVEALLEEFADQLAFVFRHFPLSTIHPKAGVAAQAAEAAAGQAAFWKMHHALYQHPGGEATDDLERVALRIGLEMYKFNSDMMTGIHADRVARDVASGKASGVRGTPTFFLDGHRLDHPPADARDAVRRRLEGAA